MEKDEEVIDIFLAGDYKSNFIFAFENGKLAKIPLESYATKTNRKKLINAYSDNSKLIKILQIAEDIDMVAYSNVGKILVFNTKD